MSTLDFNQRRSLQDEKEHVEYISKHEPIQAETLKPVLIYLNKRIEELTQQL